MVPFNRTVGENSQTIWSEPALTVASSSTEIVIISEEARHEPLEIVHCKTAEAPIISPVTSDVGEDGVVIVAVPEITVQLPVPVTGVFPARIVVVKLHKFWSGPASAAVTGSPTVIIMSSKEGGQELLDIVQRRVDEAPMVNPVTPDVGDDGVVTVAVPAITVHVPVPETGVFAANVAVVILHNNWSGPASAVVGGGSIVIVIISEEEAQAPLEIVHCNVAELPITRSVTPEVGEEGVVIVAVPDTTDQVPVPTAGVFPANIVVVTSHKFWSGPASAAVGETETFITTSSVEGRHTPFETVQRRVAEAPTASPVTPDVGEVGVVTVAVPEITDQTPVPTAGVLPAKVVVVILHKFWSGPAFAVVGDSSILIVILSEEGGQVPFEIDHCNVADDPITSPVTPDVGDAGVVTVAVPDATDHAPVPTAGVLPAKVVVVVLHNVWSGPALAAEGEAYTVITTLSVEEQVPFVILHRKVAVVPTTSPVTPDVGEEGVVMVAEPEITVHVPVPTAGVFPANVVVVTLHKP